METIIYDRGFNLNEWTVLALMIGGMLAITLLPKKLPLFQTIYCLLIGVVLGLLFDHTIAIEPFDYYDVGDSSRYQWFDVLSYAMYAPFGYIFIYTYLAGKKRFSRYWLIILLVAWSLAAILIEWVGVEVGIFHYKKGYKLLYSFPIYLFVQTLHLSVYYLLFEKDVVSD